MNRITIQEILEATGGVLVRSCDEKYITGVKHDSRECQPGDMFVAIPGENQDGHKYIPQVAAGGCRTVLVSHEEYLTDDMNINAIKVSDTVYAMGQLAAWYLDTLNIRKIAVTGSVGKTSVRDMIYYVLSRKYNCGRNLKNYNNAIGLPISIFTFDSSTEAAVLEIGMNHFGELRRLGEIVRPDVAVITNIGVAHIENLGSRDGIFKAKMEVTENLALEADGGTLIYAADPEFLTKERTTGDYSRISIGTDGHSDYIVSDIDDFGVDGIQFTMEFQAHREKIKIPVPGIHNAYNAAIAIAAGNVMGVSLEEAMKGLAEVTLTGSRLKLVECGGVSVIDDTYNANPDSMKSALKVLERSSCTGKRVAILGDMYELGERSPQLHRSIGIFARGCRIDTLVAIGENAREIASGAEGGEVTAAYFRTKKDFEKNISQYVGEGDLVLIKGSRGMKMEEVIHMIKEKR